MVVIASQLQSTKAIHTAMQDAVANYGYLADDNTGQILEFEMSWWITKLVRILDLSAVVIKATKTIHAF